jgi:type II secretory pathway component GspD/PulD (secretin)
LTPEEAIQALNTVLALNGITIIPQGEKFVRAVLADFGSDRRNAFFEMDASQIPEGDQFITQIVKLKYAAPKKSLRPWHPHKKSSGVVAIPSAQTIILRDLSSVVETHARK